jgi:hypothetical protein
MMMIVHFVLDQYTSELDFYSVTISLKQHSVGRHVTPLWHIIQILSQPVFVFLAEKQQIKFQSLVWPDSSSNPNLSHSKTSPLTITTPPT